MVYANESCTIGQCRLGPCYNKYIPHVFPTTVLCIKMGLISAHEFWGYFHIVLGIWDIYRKKIIRIAGVKIIGKYDIGIKS